MDLFSHHAYRIHGDQQAVRVHIHTLVDSAAENEGGSQVTYIDESEDTLSIDTVRSLQERLYTRVSPNEKRIVSIAFSLGTQEAQNALLKLCEEPGENTLLFFITPSEHALLPTLRSRTQHIEHSLEPLSHSPIDIESFVSAPYTERFEMLKPLIEEKNKEQMIQFLNDLETYTVAQKEGETKTSFLHTLELVRSYVLERGCSPKLLLDLCAVYTPR